MAEIQATIVFEKIWGAIHTKCHVCQGVTTSLPCDWCLGSGREYRYIVLPGSSRSSKTHSIIQVFYLYAHKNKAKRLSAWRDTKKLCKDTVFNDMTRIYPEMPLYSITRLNQTESVYQFMTGSSIEIKGTDDPHQVHGYNGDVVWLNEPYDISEDTFNQLDQRCSDFMLIDLNPKEDHWSDRIAKDSRAIIIHSTFKDNPFCPPEQKAKILSYQPVKLAEVVTTKLLTEEQAKLYDFINNQFTIGDKALKELSRCIENERKGTASEFNWKVYGLGIKAEKPHRIFFWEEIPDEVYHKLNAKRYYGSDWGVVDPWGVLEAKYYDGALYLHELNYHSEDKLRERLTPQQLSKINQMDEGLVPWQFTNMKIDKKCYIICDNNRELKILSLRRAGYDYAIAASKPPGSIIDGINLLKSLKIYYTKSSENIRKEQEAYSREVDRYGVVLEVPVDRDNHLMDPARYVATFLQIQGIIKVV